MGKVCGDNYSVPALGQKDANKPGDEKSPYRRVAVYSRNDVGEEHMSSGSIRTTMECLCWSMLRTLKGRVLGSSEEGRPL